MKILFKIRKYNHKKCVLIVNIYKTYVPVCVDHCKCSLDDWNPVCGGDGKTYYSPCYAKCDGVDVLCYGVCPCGHNAHSHNEIESNIAN